VAKLSFQRLKEQWESLKQWIKSHQTAVIAISVSVYTLIIAPILVALILEFIGKRSAEPAVIVDAGDFGVGYEGEVLPHDVLVYNAGDATAEYCDVNVTDMHTQKDFEDPNVFSVAPERDHVERLVLRVPKVPKGQEWDLRRYRIRAVCSNDVSPDSYTTMEVH
jgi:hypothetical protein